MVGFVSQAHAPLNFMFKNFIYEYSWKRRLILKLGILNDNQLLKQTTIVVLKTEHGSIVKSLNEFQILISMQVKFL